MRACVRVHMQTQSLESPRLYVESLRSSHSLHHVLSRTTLRCLDRLREMYAGFVQKKFHCAARSCQPGTPEICRMRGFSIKVKRSVSLRCA